MQGTMSKIAALLALSIRLVFAQSAPGIQPNVTFCNWAGLRSGIIRDTIYLDGGSLWWQSGTDSEGLPVTAPDVANSGRMFSLNLSYAFDTATFNETTSLLQPLSKTGGTASNNIAPNYVDGALFANDGEFYLYGGLTRLTDAYDPPAARAVLGYEANQYGPERIGWSTGFIQATLPDNVTRYVSSGASVSVPSENLGFYFSGIRGAGWGAITEATRDWYLANTLIEVDMSTMRGEQWSNNTLPDVIPRRAGAEIVWIPVGGQGALVAIGGMTAVEYRLSTRLNSSQLSDAEEQAPGFMTSLPVYDIVSKTWYMQNTTGDDPGQLTGFCSVVAPAKDSSSFNIYLYGGYDGLNDTSIPFDDVWILSVPSFTWVKAYSGVRAHGRRGHRCERIYPDQMLIIGGVNPNSQQCIGSPIQIFNLNTLEFKKLYDPREWSEYAVPAVVTAVIGGNGQGSSTKPTNFSDNALSSLFEIPYTKTVKTYFPYSSASGSPGVTPVPTAVPNNGGLAKWVAPVLGVVLGLILLSIIAVLILLYRRRKLLRRNSIATSNAGSSYNNRILNWVNGMPNQPSEGKTDPSVTSTEFDNDTDPSSPRAGVPEVAGQERYEKEAVEKIKPVTELATPFNFQDHPNYPRNIDFAYGAGAGSSGQPSQPQRSESNYSQPQIHGLGLVASPTSTAVSPQSPHPHSPNHLHSNSGDSRTGDPGSSIGDRGDAPSPYVLPHSPEDVGGGAGVGGLNNRSPTASPSPTSSAAVSPNLHGQHSKNVSADTTTDTNAAPVGSGGGSTGGLERRPTHQRNVSSLSSHIHQLPSPDVVWTPEEDLRRSQLISGLASHPSQNLGQPRLGALDRRVEGGREGEQLVSPEGGVGGMTGRNETASAGVERKKTAGKKSSFGEMLDEGDEAGK